eukprot:GHVS01091932.1.p1 GENE.GHVS01091932.1~~GHVS01091932.1.p1  ORF type:complete len:299 (+),score=61.09 GHVS01091932.1:260-1156(+)
MSVVGRRTPGRSVQWFVATRPGRDPVFASTATKTSMVFQAPDSAVGRFVKVRVSRRIESGDFVGDTVFSEGVRGPITLDDSTAKQLLEVVAQAAVPVNISFEPNTAMILLNEPKEKIQFKEDSVQGQLWILRQGIVFRVGEVEVVERSLGWENFYVTRNQDKEEANVLVFHLPAAGEVDHKCKVTCPNEDQRNLLHHVIIFYKLSTSFGDFNRWANDLETGNYATVKSRYARNWANTTWENYQTAKASSAAAAGVADAAEIAFDEEEVGGRRFGRLQTAAPREDRASDDWESSEEEGK